MASVPLLLQQAQQYHRNGQFQLAEQGYRQILSMHPDQVDALHGLGFLALQHKQFPLAIELLGRAIQLQPERWEALYQLAETHLALGNAVQAEELFRRILAAHPDHADSHLSRGICLMSMDRIEEAASEIETAARLAPQAGNARANLSIARVLRGMWRLQRGDYAQGWADFEARLELQGIVTNPAPAGSELWTDQDLHGKTLLIYNDERGLGDAIQFVRFLPDIKKLGPRIILQCKPVLRDLFESVAGVQTLITTEEPAPQVDYHVPLLSLPHRLKITLDNLPADIPYLCVLPEEQDLWESRVGPRQPGKLRVGIAWAGSADTGHDMQRSMSPDAFAILCDLPNVELHSLQIENRGTPSERLAAQLIDHTRHVLDMADTAALLETLDLVITVDTATAHLGGALGKETWILLHQSPDWRWMLATDRSPWYPTVRLFRQDLPGDWTPVLQRVRLALLEKIQ